MAVLKNRAASVLAVLFWGCTVVPLHSVTAPEYQIKAAFLFNFALFVQWPAQAFSDPQSPLIIGVLGEDPFGRYLDDIVLNEKIGNRLLAVRRYRTVEEIEACHVLFIGQSEENQLEETLAALKNRSVLTVSDFVGFARRGGMIRLVTEGGKVRYRINLTATTSEGLTISSKVLRPAQIIGPGQD